MDDAVMREVEALPADPAPNSVLIMRAVDRMSKPFRPLVYEYGFVIVRDMIADGARDARGLERDLKTWRQRRQVELLK